MADIPAYVCCVVVIGEIEKGVEDEDQTGRKVATLCARVRRVCMCVWFEHALVYMYVG